MAEHELSISRRAALGALAAISTPFGASADAAGLDAELLRLSARYWAEEAELLALEEPWFDIVGGAPKGLRDGWQPRHAAQAHLRARALGLPAHTPDGLRAKARFATEHMHTLSDGQVPPDNDDYAAWAFVRDVLRFLDHDARR